MITEWFIELAMGFVGWIGGLLPEGSPVEDVMDAQQGLVPELFEFMGVLAGFIPWMVVVPIILIPLLVWVIGFLWKTARTVFSHVPQIGGSG